jgi:hypothetical protein
LTSAIQSLGDLHVGFAGGGVQDDLGPLDQAGGQGSAARSAPSRPAVLPLTISWPLGAC